MQYITKNKNAYLIQFSNGEYLKNGRGFEGVPIEEATQFDTKKEVQIIFNAFGKNKIIVLYGNKTVTREKIVNIHAKVTTEITILD